MEKNNETTREIACDTYCPICFDCKWTVVVEDSTDKRDETPFWQGDFSDLLPGDEIIRCRECNSLTASVAEQRRKRYEETVC